MIADAHCHAWREWPYSATVPDRETRGNVQQLLDQLRTHSVGRALLVCAGIGVTVGDKNENGDNNEYARAAVEANPGVLNYVVDVDSEWSRNYHQPGAAVRLERVLARHPLASGITHYLRADDDWLTTSEAADFFTVLDERGLIASVSAPPSRARQLADVAAAAPRVTVVLHHMGQVRTQLRSFAEDMRAVVDAAAAPNLLVKVSGFHYMTATDWDFPFPAAEPVLRTLVREFGVERLMWGSDFPATVGKVTYRQTLEAPRALMPDLADADAALMMGGNLIRILDNIHSLKGTAHVIR